MCNNRDIVEIDYWYGKEKANDEIEKGWVYLDSEKERDGTTRYTLGKPRTAPSMTVNNKPERLTSWGLMFHPTVKPDPAPLTRTCKDVSVSECNEYRDCKECLAVQETVQLYKVAISVIPQGVKKPGMIYKFQGAEWVFVRNEEIGYSNTFTTDLSKGVYRLCYRNGGVALTHEFTI